MRRFPQDGREYMGEMPTTEEEVAFEEFCSQLKAAVDNYVVRASATDAGHRFRRALNFLTNVAGALSEVLDEGALRN